MQPISKLVQRFADDWQSAGPLGALKRVAVSASWKLYPPRRKFAQALEREQKLADEFDRRHNVETARDVPLAEVGISAGAVDRGNGIYRGIWPQMFREAMSAITFDVRPYTFVDYGSGKGKAMLLASLHPFARIVGVEYSRPLHEIAVENLKRFTSSEQQCRDLTSVCGDATAFEPPAGPLLCFFFNPFDDATTREVIAKLRASVQREPRPVYLLYVNVRSVRERERAFVSEPGVTLVSRAQHHLLARLSPAS